MNFQSVRWLAGAVVAVAVVGCGDGDDGALNGAGAAGGAGGSGATGGSAGGGTGGGTGGSAGAGTGGSAGAGTGGSAGAGTGGSAGGGSGGSGGCTAATDVTYNLDGSTFRIGDTPLGAGNQTNTCEAPYTQNDQIGPGTMVIRFTGDGTAPGPAWIVSYTMDLTFTVSQVQTRLQTEAVPAGTECSVAAGTFNAGAFNASPAVIHNYHTFGDVLCSGALCGIAGLPNGTPQPQDDTGDQAINAFTFTNGVGAFTMPEVLVSQDQNSKTYLALTGTEVSRTASCACP